MSQREPAVCLEDEAVAAYARGGLSGVASSNAEEHLDTCSHCRNAVAAVLADTDVTAEESTGGRKSRGSVVVAQAEATLGARYRVLGPLGRGGMAGVVRALDTSIGREVAVKLIDPRLGEEPGYKERFAQEAQALGRVDHPNVVSVHDADAERGYMVMELVDGEPLGASTAPLSSRELREIAAQLLGALGAVHKAGVVHRDIKPSNVVRRADGSVVLVDFGVARIDDRTLTRAGDAPGTPAYMAPEQLRGEEVDERTDLHGLGVTLFELATRERFDATQPERSLAKLRAQSSDRELRDLIGGCVEPNPADRFASADEALRALRGQGRKSPWFVAPVAAALACAIGIGFAATRPHTAEPTASSAATGATSEPPPVASLEAPAASSSAVVEGDPDALGNAFRLAQRGELERARPLVDEHLRRHPDNPDAHVLNVLVVWWTHLSPGDLEAAFARAAPVALSSPQRAIVEGVLLLSRGRASEARGLMERAIEKEPPRADLYYVLGEAAWHAGDPEAGARWLEKSFTLDPKWQLALQHLADYDLVAGRTERVRGFAHTLRGVDEPGAIDLDARVAFAEREYSRAASIASLGLARHPDAARLWIRMAEAAVMNEHLDTAASALAEAERRSPVDGRGDGALAHRLELSLYKGDFDGFIREAPQRPRVLVDLLWRGSTVVELATPSFVKEKTMSELPVTAATYFLWAQRRGTDVTNAAAVAPDPEVRAYSRALAAEIAGDLALAEAGYAEGLRLAARSDLRMLLCHHLARARQARSDPEGARVACDEVLHPRVYHPYRAMVLPDCALWSGKPHPNLVASWTGGFTHPSIEALRAQHPSR